MTEDLGSPAWADDAFIDRLHDLIDDQDPMYRRPPYISPESFLELRVCESPIEVLFGYAFLCHSMNCTGINVYVERSRNNLDLAGYISILNDFCQDAGCCMLYGPDAKLVMIPQATLGQYRVDFLILCREWYGTWSHRQGPVAAVIECDGHAFHERTKRQAARDKARDRWLQGLNLPVLRFTGSEIWKDPMCCADEAWRLITRNARHQPVIDDGENHNAEPNRIGAEQ